MTTKTITKTNHKDNHKDDHKDNHKDNQKDKDKTKIRFSGIFLVPVLLSAHLYSLSGLPYLGSLAQGTYKHTNTEQSVVQNCKLLFHYERDQPVSRRVPYLVKKKNSHR